MRSVSRSRAAPLVAAGLLGTATACWLAARGVEPVATWLYPFAWYPLLLAVEGGVALRRGRFLLLGRLGLLLSVLAWSVPLWMLWEILNFRLENWYYVFVPDRRAALWTGVILSFATVLPACFLPAALVWPGPGSGGPPEDGRKEPGGAGPGKAGAGDASGRSDGDGAVAGAMLSDGALRAIRLAGAVMLVLPVIRPRIFFPLVWGAFVLLAEPDLHRSAPGRSLLADVVAGRRDRIVALLTGGALAGLVWEALNTVARGSWIYTVPGLEELKLFEMPLLGFFGFPPLALSCFSLYQWMGLRRWSVPLRLEPGASRGEAGESDAAEASASAGAARVAATVLVVVTLLGMEAETISSRTPHLRDLPGLLPSDVEAMRAWGIDSPFALARVEPAALADRVPGVDTAEARGWVEAARLATTRGIGTRHARFLHSWEVGSLAALARTEPDALAACFRAVSSADVRPAQVRLWWRAARRRTGVDGTAEGAPRC